MPTPSISPRRFLLAFALIFGSGIPAAVVAIVLLVMVFASLVRVDAPGSKELRLEAGNYTAYWEVEGASSEGLKPPQVQMRVELKDDMTPVTVESVGNLVSRYSTGSASGVSVFDFRIARAGEYRISVTAPAQPPVYPGRISVSKSFGLKTLLSVVAIPMLLGVGGTIAGILVLLKRPATPA